MTTIDGKIMNDLIKQFVEQAGGDFWQRIESDGVLNKEAYITFDPPENLSKFVELIVGECLDIVANADMTELEGPDPEDVLYVACKQIKEHFGVK